MDKIINDHLLACANQDGIVIIDTPLNIWSLGVKKENAIQYKNDYNRDQSINNGFFEHDGKVILTHNGLKMSLKLNETKAILELIEVAEKELW